MTDSISSIAGTSAVRPASASDQAHPQNARGSRFAALLYAVLKPPTLDLSEAAGDFEDEAPSAPPMKAYIKPNLSKLLGEASGTAPATHNVPVSGSTRST